MAVAVESAKAGLDPMFNPDWFLTDEQRALREQLIEICEQEIRPHAAENDANLTFPRASLEALGPFLASPCRRSGAASARATRCWSPRPRRSRATAARPRPCATRCTWVPSRPCA
ncbi:MAG: acyl-CoA dehydrogenase family protein [Actinomycetota bacterium]